MDMKLRGIKLHAMVLLFSIMLATGVSLKNSCSHLLDCSSCLIEAGCHWCPEDNKCYGSNTTTNNLEDSIPFPSPSSCAATQSYSQVCPDNEESNIFDHQHLYTYGREAPKNVLSSNSFYTPETFFNDERYSEEVWAFKMINIYPVWEKGYRGNGIHVRINDNGVDATHAEFEGRFDEEASCPSYTNPSSEPPGHGTSVASILGATGNNGECSVGVAPEVTLSSCYALSPSESFLEYKLDSVDISQNSFERPACSTQEERRRKLASGDSACPFHDDPSVIPGTHPCEVCTDFNSISESCENSIFEYCRINYENDVDGCSGFLDIMIGDDGCEYHSLSETARNAFTYGTEYGRGGKGVIFLFGSGNNYFRGDWTTIKMYTNTRHVITVGAVGSDGRHSSYSTPGPTVFVVAPGGDIESPNMFYAASAGGGCGFPGVGTSFSTPIVSGIVALMLEANPDLTWRDVQGILATTSRPVTQFTGDDSAAFNGAGLWHSNLYGFGLVDAAAAVEAAESWSFFGPEEMVVGATEVDLPIVDDPESEISTSIFIDQENFIVESVAVLLEIKHRSRGDLDIVLTSPDGTESILHPGKLPENKQLDQNEKWELMTVRNWGERATGSWTLTVRDEKTGSYGPQGCVNSPYSVDYSGVSGTCDYVETEGICQNGAINEAYFEPGYFDSLRDLQDEVNGGTMSQQCCICGGGIPAEDFEEKLLRWKIVVYGRTSATTEPSLSPVFNSSVEPTSSTTIPPSKLKFSASSPTYSPSLVPYDAPSMIPSDAPSIIPSDAPSIIPSDAPSIAPSIAPSTSADATVSPTTNDSTRGEEASATDAPSEGSSEIIEFSLPADEPVLASPEQFPDSSGSLSAFLNKGIFLFSCASLVAWLMLFL